MSIVKAIKLLEKERLLLMEGLLNTRCMLRGTYKKYFRRCGQATCWCVTAEKGHPYCRVTGTKDAKGFSKSIQKQDIPWVKEVTIAYKHFRKLRQRLRQLNEEQRILLNTLEEDVTEKTRRLRNYL